MDNLLTTDEAAAYLKITRRTLTRMADAGEIEFYMVGKRRRFTREAIQKYLTRGGEVSPDAIAREGE
jgi:excisionase family DNA binding protein